MYPTYNNYYPTQSQQQIRQPQQIFGLKGRPVASIEEVKASPVDFDGSVFFFPDLANKKIYTKQINVDGTASLCMYELKEIPRENMNIQSGNYITREEFDSAIAKIQEMLPKVEGQTKGVNYEF